MFRYGAFRSSTAQFYPFFHDNYRKYEQYNVSSLYRILRCYL
nr:MAG TPA: hypothetical protein [Caudoviricetes sp.]